MDAQRFITGLHLTHQLRIRSLGFHQGRDRELCSFAVTNHQLCGAILVVMLKLAAIELLNAVLLNQQPAITRLKQCINKSEKRIGVIGQMHFWW